MRVLTHRYCISNWKFDFSLYILQFPLKTLGHRPP
ncbi:hypothetical protein BLAT2472_230003 [Burkholderia latens]